MREEVDLSTYWLIFWIGKQVKLSKEFNSFFPDLIDMQLNSPCKFHTLFSTGNKNINLILPVRSISYSQTSDENIETCRSCYPDQTPNSCKKFTRNYAAAKGKNYQSFWDFKIL